MKLTKLTALALIATTGGAFFTTSAQAATDTTTSTGEVTYEKFSDATDPIHPGDPGNKDIEDKGTGNTGELTIDYVSSIQFPNQKVTGNDAVYFAKMSNVTLEGGTLEATPNYVQVSDNSGTNSGWKLKVKQDNQFKNADGKELTAAALSFKNGDSVKKVDFLAMEKPSVHDVTLTPGENHLIASAETDQGVGTWAMNFGGADNGAESISLAVPGKYAKVAGTYSTTLTWEVSNTAD